MPTRLTELNNPRPDLDLNPAGERHQPIRHPGGESQQPSAQQTLWPIDSGV